MTLTPHIVPEERTDAEIQKYSQSYKAIRDAVIVAVIEQVRISKVNPLFITHSDFRRRFQENVSSPLFECSDDIREHLLYYVDTCVSDSFYNQYRDVCFAMEMQRKNEKHLKNLKYPVNDNK